MPRDVYKSEGNEKDGSPGRLRALGLLLFSFFFFTRGGGQVRGDLKRHRAVCLHSPFIILCNYTALRRYVMSGPTVRRFGVLMTLETLLFTLSLWKQELRKYKPSLKPHLSWFILMLFISVMTIINLTPKYNVYFKFFGMMDSK